MEATLEWLQSRKDIRTSPENQPLLESPTETKEGVPLGSPSCQLTGSQMAQNWAINWVCRKVPCLKAWQQARFKVGRRVMILA